MGGRRGINGTEKEGGEWNLKEYVNDKTKKYLGK